MYENCYRSNFINSVHYSCRVESNASAGYSLVGSENFCPKYVWGPRPPQDEGPQPRILSSTQDKVRNQGWVPRPRTRSSTQGCRPGMSSATQNEVLNPRLSTRDEFRDPERGPRSKTGMDQTTLGHVQGVKTRHAEIQVFARPNTLRSPWTDHYNRTLISDWIKSSQSDPGHSLVLPNIYHWFLWNAI